MNKTRTLIAVLLFAGATLTQAIPVADSVTGGTNSLKAEFSFPFNEGFSLTGSWHGGTYILSGSVQVVHSGFQLEMYQDIWLQTFWNDGWSPGGLGNRIVGTNPSHNFTLTTLDLSQPYPDFGPNNLQYYLNASAWVELTLVPETRSGFGTISYDIFRRPVPDTGSTLTLLGLALSVLVPLRFRSAASD